MPLIAIDHVIDKTIGEQVQVEKSAVESFPILTILIRNDLTNQVPHTTS